MFEAFSLKSQLAKTAGLNREASIRQQLRRFASDGLGQASSVLGHMVGATEIKGAGIV